MTLPTETLPRKSRLAALLDHFAQVEDPRDIRRILHPLPEVLLLVVCAASPIATTTKTSPPGARRVSAFSASTFPTSMAFQASAGSPS